MNFQDLAAYLKQQSTQTSLSQFALHLVVTALLCWLLARFYVAFGTTSSNRRGFARTFVLLGVTTTLIVTVIQTSLALSLGLVGALSIVRFRGAIKEPEEVAYIFAVIAIGLGVGAQQEVVTSLAACALFGLIYLNHRARRAPDECNLVLTVSSGAPEVAGRAAIVAVLKRHCPDLNLKRLDETKQRVEAVFLLPGADYAALDKVTAELLALSDQVRVTLLDNEGVF